jgi:hypothetical protein
MFNYRFHVRRLALVLVSFLSCFSAISHAVAADLEGVSGSDRRATSRQVANIKLIAQSNGRVWQSGKSDISQQAIWPNQSFKTDASQQPTSPKVKTSDLVNALRKTKLIDPSYKLGATANGDQIVITTERKPKSTDNECKIEAVLIGKAMFETVPSDFQRTKVLLFDYVNDKCSEVTVKRAEVKLFGSGGLTEKELLSSLELNITDASDQSAPGAVAPGPMQAGRISLLARIQRLKSRGTDTAPFEKMFAALEESAKSNDSAAVHGQYEELKRVLNEESDMVKSARSAGHHGHQHRQNN